MIFDAFGYADMPLVAAAMLLMLLMMADTRLLPVSAVFIVYCALQAATRVRG